MNPDNKLKAGNLKKSSSIELRSKRRTITKG